MYIYLSQACEQPASVQAKHGGLRPPFTHSSKLFQVTGNDVTPLYHAPPTIPVRTRQIDIVYENSHLEMH